jgi:hypothetical protein
VPEMPGPDADGNEPSEEEKRNIEKKIDEINALNKDA